MSKNTQISMSEIPESISPLKYYCKKPLQDQTEDIAKHLQYSVSLRLPELEKCEPRHGRAIIVGGGPSVEDHLEEIRNLKSDPTNVLFAINWTHTWLINNGITPDGCVFFEVDAEPDSVLKAAHPAVTYFICSHCHNQLLIGTSQPPSPLPTIFMW